MNERRSYDADIKDIKKVLEKTEETNTKAHDRIILILEGNGGIGLTTQTALNKQSIARLWYLLSGTGFFGIMVAVFLKVFE